MVGKDICQSIESDIGDQQLKDDSLRLEAYYPPPAGELGERYAVQAEICAHLHDVAVRREECPKQPQFELRPFPVKVGENADHVSAQKEKSAPSAILQKGLHGGGTNPTLPIGSA